MTLIKWNNPFRELDNFFDDDFFPVSWHRKRSGSQAAAFSPKANIVEREKDYVLELELPGVKKEEVKVEVKDGVLTVSGERTNKQERKSDHYYSFETSYGRFERSFQVSELKEKEIEARFSDGVLRLTLPKKEEVIERKEARKIAIK